MRSKSIILIVIDAVVIFFTVSLIFTNSLRIQNMIWDANFCEKDADCMNINFGCSFGCGDYVNVDKASNLQMWTSISNLRHPSHLLAKCSCLPPPKYAVCENNKCIPKKSNVGVYYNKFEFYAGRECECPGGTIANITEKGMICYGIERAPIVIPD
jgi:hypothetical protein